MPSASVTSGNSERRRTGQKHVSTGRTADVKKHIIKRGETYEWV